MSSDPNHSSDFANRTDSDASQNDPANSAPSSDSGTPAGQQVHAGTVEREGDKPVVEDAARTEAAGTEEERKQKIRIGSQRPGVPVPRVEPRVKIAGSENTDRQNAPRQNTQQQQQRPPRPQQQGGQGSRPQNAGDNRPAPVDAPNDAGEEALSGSAGAATGPQVAPTGGPAAPKPQQLKPGKNVKQREQPIQHTPRVEVPNLRAELPPDLNQELEDALGGMSLEDLIEGEGAIKPPSGQLDPDTKYKGRITGVHRDNVFVEVDGRSQGYLPLKGFTEDPVVGTVLEVTVGKFNAEDGIYELKMPHGATNVSDWADISEGMIIEARVTGHNKGGLECEVNKLRGFIPAGQVSIYRVEDLEQFVGQKFACVVTEANPERRNLVLSRRGVLEREQAEAKQKLMKELEVGQEREGIVRSLRDFGAFVDLGGVDGLIHISQMSWDRVKHPSDVLEVGQKVKVKVQKIDEATGKISLAYRDLAENPWTDVTKKYPPTSIAKGTVSRIMDFGAFVRLESGVEGLIHISELAHRRVFRASDIVQEGQSVEVKVLTVDPDSQRISLSLKALEARPVPAGKQAEPEPEEDDTPPPPQKERKTPLKGGLTRGGDGDKFGLKW